MHRKPDRLRRLRAALIALALVVGAIVVSVFTAPRGIAPAGSDAPLSVVQECQAALGYDSRSPADVTWLQQCVSALTAPTPGPTVSPSGTTTGTPPPTASPTPTATSSPTPAPTTPPASPTATASPTGGPTGSSSPTASPTGPPSSPPNSGACLPKPSACGYPDASNTGVPAGTQLTAVQGDLTITTAGTVVSGKDIHGCVNVRANNVTIRNSRITCLGAYGIRGFNNGVDFTGLLISDVEIDGQSNSASFTGVAYSNFVAVRVNIHGYENGFAISGNATVKDSWVHDLKFTGPEHPDGAQFTDDAANIVIQHNTIVAPVTNSALAICCSTGAMDHEITVDRNLLAGGGFTLYTPRQSTTGIVITNNRFGPSNFGPCSCYAAGITTWTSNVFDATGAPVPQA